MADLPGLRHTEISNIIINVLSHTVERYLSVTPFGMEPSVALWYHLLFLTSGLYVGYLQAYRISREQTERAEDDLLFKDSHICLRPKKLATTVMDAEEDIIKNPSSWTPAQRYSDTAHTQERLADCDCIGNTFEDKEDLGIPFWKWVMYEPRAIIAMLLGWNWSAILANNMLDRHITNILVILLLYLLSRNVQFPYRIYFPYVRPRRKGRQPVHGPCKECSDFLRQRSMRASICSRQRRNDVSNLPQRVITMNSISTMSWSREDTSYIYLRVCLFSAISFMRKADLPIKYYITQQVCMQLLVSLFSPVTIWGNDIRDAVGNLSAVWAILQLVDTHSVAVIGRIKDGETLVGYGDILVYRGIKYAFASISGLCKR